MSGSEPVLRIFTWADTRGIAQELVDWLGKYITYPNHSASSKENNTVGWMGETRLAGTG